MKKNAKTSTGLINLHILKMSLCNHCTPIVLHFVLCVIIINIQTRTYYYLNCIPEAPRLYGYKIKIRMVQKTLTDYT